MSTLGWEKYAHVPIGIDTFGASAPYLQVYEKFGLTADVISKKALKVIEFYKGAVAVLKSPINKPIF